MTAVIAVLRRTRYSRQEDEKVGIPYPVLSNTATYAVRALAHLARQPPGHAVLGRDLAELAGVPANYLSKILLTLKKAGVVEATRGLGGGYRLSRPAEEISLAEAVDLFDPLGALPDCLLGQETCSDENPCVAHERWSRVKSTYLDFLNHTSLAELSKSTDLDPTLEIVAA